MITIIALIIVFALAILSLCPSKYKNNFIKKNETLIFRISIIIVAILILIGTHL